MPFYLAGYCNSVPIGRGLLPLEGEGKIRALELVGDYQGLCYGTKRMLDLFTVSNTLSEVIYQEDFSVFTIEMISGCIALDPTKVV